MLGLGLSIGQVATRSTGGGYKALPLPVGARVVFSGDSYVSMSASTSTTGTPITSFVFSHGSPLGDHSLIRAFDNRWNADAWWDPASPTTIGYPREDPYAKWSGAYAGIGGDTLSYLKLRMAAIVARRPDIVVIDCGVNDITVGSPYETVVADLEASLAQLATAKIWAVVRTKMHHGYWPDGDARYTILDAYNAYIAALSGRKGIVVCDDRAAMQAAADVYGWTYLWESDANHLHPSPAGNLVRTSVLLPILRSMVSPGDYISSDYTTGNLLTIGGLLGTSGSKGGGITGSVATGVTAALGSGQNDTVVASKEVISAGVGEKQVFTITPKTNANSSRLCQLTMKWADQTFASAGLAAGDWVSLSVDIEMSAGTYWYGGLCSLSWYNGASTFLGVTNGGLDFGTSPVYPPLILTSATTFRCIIGKAKILSTADGLAQNPDRFRFNSRGIYIFWDKNGDGQPTGVVKVSPPILRKVSDPRPTWRL